MATKKELAYYIYLCTACEMQRCTGRTTSIGYVVGKASPCNFCHAVCGIAITVHGDDFIAGGSTANLQFMKNDFERHFDVTAQTLGPEVGQQRELCVS